MFCQRWTTYDVLNYIELTLTLQIIQSFAMTGAVGYFGLCCPSAFVVTIL